MPAAHDAVVVGAGPNGLAAAVVLARAGRRVLLVEAAEAVGGGTRSAALTLPGFVHDVCSAVHPLGAASPLFTELPLEHHGLRWRQPELPLSHPLDGGRAAVLTRSLDSTAAVLDDPDGGRYRRLLDPVVEHWGDLVPMVLGPVLRVPRHPVTLARFGLRALPPATTLARAFAHDEARALIAGCAGHAILPLGHPLTASFAVVLMAAAATVGWPVAEGGSEAIARSLAAHFEALGGEVRTGWQVETLAELPPSRVVLFDLAPSQVARIAGDALPERYRRRLLRYRHGQAVFKVDYALDGPVPWADEHSGRAGTVHLGGTLEEIAVAEAEVARGRHPEHPFVLAAQPSLVDATRAPAGRHTLWAYCHVPARSTVDMTAAIERQIERFAPGFGDRVLARHVAGPAWFEAHNPAYVGGDIAGGSHGGLQLVARPTLGRPYRTPNDRLLLCSASTPPGAGVHGMGGYHAARAALAGPLR